MHDNSGKSPLNINEVADITNELHEGRLSRHGLSERLKGLGLGFGAAFVLGMTGAQAATAPDSAVVLKSTNTAINSIIDNGSQPGQTAIDGNGQQVAWYTRFYRRFFRRFFRRW
jgi:hypothetical protein